MFKMKLWCTTHQCPVISAEATLKAKQAPFVFIKDGEAWTMDEGNLYCVQGEGTHEWTFRLYDLDGNYLAGDI